MPSEETNPEEGSSAARATEAGDHDALVRHDGTYARMVRRQAGSYETPTARATLDPAASDPAAS